MKIVTEFLRLKEDGTFIVGGWPKPIQFLKDAAIYAQCHQKTIKVFANHTWVTIAPDSEVDLLWRDFNRAMDGCIDEVGPYPKRTLDPHNLRYDQEMRSLRNSVPVFAERDAMVSAKIGSRTA